MAALDDPAIIDTLSANIAAWVAAHRHEQGLLRNPQGLASHDPIRIGEGVPVRIVDPLPTTLHLVINRE